MVEGFGQLPRIALLAESRLHIAQGEVQSQRQPRNMGRSIHLGNGAPSPADQHHHFHFVMQGVAVCGDGNRCAGGGEAGGGFHKHHRLFRRGGTAQFLHVLGIIFTDAEQALGSITFRREFNRHVGGLRVR